MTQLTQTLKSEKKVLVTATLDTKEEQVLYLLRCLMKNGVKTLLMDSGISGATTLAADITREEVAKAGGSTIEEIRDMASGGGEGKAIAQMMKGVSRMAVDLYESGRLSGILALGGSMGTTLATAAMKELPFGVPKIMLSTLASGNVAPFVGVKDIVMLHTVADLIGLNSIIRRVIEDAALTMAGMVNGIRDSDTKDNRKIVSLTTKGYTEKVVQAVRKKLEEEGYETVTFTTTAGGGLAMEDLIAKGRIDMVMDISLFDVINSFCGKLGHIDSGPNRLLAAINRGIPLLVVPGNTDFFAYGGLTYEQLKERFPGRAIAMHNPSVGMMRWNCEEETEFGRALAERLNLAKGPVAAVIPLKGFSGNSFPGNPLYDPDADACFVNSFKENIRSDIPVIEVDALINDEVFIDKVLETWFNLIK